jgi:hypothetical protein
MSLPNLLALSPFLTPTTNLSLPLYLSTVRVRVFKVSAYFSLSVFFKQSSLPIALSLYLSVSLFYSSFPSISTSIFLDLSNISPLSVRFLPPPLSFFPLPFLLEKTIQNRIFSITFAHFSQCAKTKKVVFASTPVNMPAHKFRLPQMTFYL